jgi:hypothetical protein
MKRSLFIGIVLLTYSFLSLSQDVGVLTGGFQSDSRYYLTDSLIEAIVPEEVIGTNNYLKLDYTINNFTIGIRYEAYLPPMQGYDAEFQGSGIANRFATYKGDLLEVTAGNYYEQFGSGLILRSYEERFLGVDNSLDGVRIIIKPLSGVNLKLIYGRHRSYFELGEGTIRGLDGEFMLNEIMEKQWKTRVTVAGSLVSKYEDYTGTKEFPSVVDSYSARLKINRSSMNFDVEYVGQGKNPSFINKYSQREGSALISNVGFFGKGFGANMTFRRLDNISNRSERDETSANNLWVNFIPALTKQHGYLLANIYPYSAQFNGEIALQTDISYAIKKGTLLGGKYGTKLSFNYSQANSLQVDSTNVENNEYGTDFWAIGDEVYYRDINFQIKKKISKKIRTAFTIYHMEYNKQQVEGTPTDNVKSLILVGELQFKLANRKSIRAELQYLSTDQDKKDWAAAVLEFNVASKWSFYLVDQYNLGGEDQVHYYQGGFSYSKSATRIEMNYGRQRGGLMCAGGVCRYVPSSTGIGLSITTSF